MAYILFIMCHGLLVGCGRPGPDTDELIWQEGYLDIHHIHTGRGNAAFMIFPDGTTLLFDAGAAAQRKTEPYYPVYPSDSLSPGAWLAHYIRQINPNHEIDYAVISHFHADHYGHADSSGRKDELPYLLSGITEVGSLIPIRQLIDRAFPDYDYPFSLQKTGRRDLENYLAFVQYQLEAGEMSASALKPGVNDQISLLKTPEEYPGFEVRNLKSNQWIWTGEDDRVKEFVFDPPLVNTSGYYSENPLSICLKINYRDFDYYTGGDLPGVKDYPDYDMETPLAGIVGEVDAMSLNHHGYHDATNANFLETLNPQVAVHQSIHDPHFQENVLTNLSEHPVRAFAIQTSERLEQKLKDLMAQTYDSQNGHVLIRVTPGGTQFKVHVLDYNDDLILEIKQTFGPYTSR